MAALSSHRPASRWRIAVVIGLLAPTFLASWGAAARAGGDSGETRPGCGTFCQNTGQYGGVGDPPPSPITILSSGTVTVEPDGYVPVTVKCNSKVQCQGALLIGLKGFSNPQDRLSWVTARADLVVNAGATQTIGLALPAGALTFLRAHGFDRPRRNRRHQRHGRHAARLRDADALAPSG